MKLIDWNLGITSAKSPALARRLTLSVLSLGLLLPTLSAAEDSIHHSRETSLSAGAFQTSQGQAGLSIGGSLERKPILDPKGPDHWNRMLIIDHSSVCDQSDVRCHDRILTLDPSIHYTGHFNLADGPTRNYSSLKLGTFALKSNHTVKGDRSEDWSYDRTVRLLPVSLAFEQDKPVESRTQGLKISPASVEASARVAGLDFCGRAEAGMIVGQVEILDLERTVASNIELMGRVSGSLAGARLSHESSVQRVGIQGERDADQGSYTGRFEIARASDSRKPKLAIAYTVRASGSRVLGLSGTDSNPPTETLFDDTASWDYGAMSRSAAAARSAESADPSADPWGVGTLKSRQVRTHEISIRGRF